MSGHSKWSTIKHKKASADITRSKLFSKLSQNISIAARNGVDPQFNSALRNAIDKAKKQNMPQANIDRAIKKASEKGNLKPLILEIYGPEGVGILAEAFTDNGNRTVGEIKVLLKKHNSKLAEQGSLLWSFERAPGGEGYIPKFVTDVSEEALKKVELLVEELREADDIYGVYPTTEL